MLYDILRFVIIAEMYRWVDKRLALCYLVVVS